MFTKTFKIISCSEFDDVFVGLFLSWCEECFGSWSDNPIVLGAFVQSVDENQVVIEPLDQYEPGSPDLEALCDGKIIVQKGEGEQSYPVSRAIMARFDYFRSVFAKSMRESSKREIRFMYMPDLVLSLIRFAYGHSLVFETAKAAFRFAILLDYIGEKDRSSRLQSMLMDRLIDRPDFVQKCLANECPAVFRSQGLTALADRLEEGFLRWWHHRWALGPVGHEAVSYGLPKVENWEVNTITEREVACYFSLPSQIDHLYSIRVVEGQFNFDEVVIGPDETRYITHCQTPLPEQFNDCIIRILRIIPNPRGGYVGLVEMGHVDRIAQYAFLLGNFSESRLTLLEGSDVSRSPQMDLTVDGDILIGWVNQIDRYTPEGKHKKTIALSHRLSALIPYKTDSQGFWVRTQEGLWFQYSDDRDEPSQLVGDPAYMILPYDPNRWIVGNTRGVYLDPPPDTDEEPIELVKGDNNRLIPLTQDDVLIARSEQKGIEIVVAHLSSRSTSRPTKIPGTTVPEGAVIRTPRQVIIASRADRGSHQFQLDMVGLGDTSTLTLDAAPNHVALHGLSANFFSAGPTRQVLQVGPQLYIFKSMIPTEPSP